jgi:hypothetical protein
MANVKKVKIDKVMLKQYTSVHCGTESRQEICLAVPRYNLEMGEGFVICSVNNLITWIPMENITAIWIKE